MKSINRKELIAVLESVTPGLAVREENVQQSSCFVLKDGKVFTFNEEVLCSAPLDLGISGAIPADLFLNLLKKLDEKDVKLKVKGAKELRIVGAHKTAGIRFDTKVELPINNVEMPDKGKWVSVPDGFAAAIDLVKNCCSSNDLHFGLRCVHFAKAHVEACDNAQACRVQMKTGLSTPSLVRYEAATHLVSAGATKMAESPNWLHFRTPNGSTLSVRRYLDKYQDLTQIFDVKGSPIKIPRALADATEKAAIFTGADATSVVSRELVTVKLSSGALEIKGTGAQGWYKETQDIKYEGPEMQFAISPRTLSRIAKEHTKAGITSSRLVIDGENWRLVFCLYQPKAEQTEQAES